MRRAAVAATRFGLGARGTEIEAAALDPEGHLLAQLEARERPTAAAGTADRLVVEQAVGRLGPAGNTVHDLRRSLADADLLARARHGAETAAPYRERWALFWLNHFALAAVDDRVEMLAGAFAREVVDTHLTGRFEDMLAAAVRHPAMLIALDQLHSVGPDSAVGRHAGRGLNENMAREILELHSVGVECGYTQGDVTQLALAITGWGFDDAGSFAHDLGRHQPGARRLLGRTYEGSPAGAEAMVRDLANRPETRRRLALKAARHFVADDPPAGLVARLAQALERSDGSLQALAQALVTAPEAWAPGQAKFKTPYEYAVSAYRAAESAPDDPVQLSAFLRQSGHSPLWAPSAAGSSDRGSAWATPLALSQRAQLAWAVGGRAGRDDPERWAEAVLGPLLGAETAKLVRSRASDPQRAAALVLMSPEFQRR